MVDMSAYQEMFLSEAREHLDALDAGMILFEKDYKNNDVVQDLMRHAHTLKGVAASMGYGEISNLSHSFEGMVENIKNSLASPAGMTLLFGAVDELRALVEATSNGEGQEHGANPLVDKVGELEQDDQQADAQLLNKPKQFQVIHEVKVKTEKLDQLVDLVSELSVNRLTLQVLHERLLEACKRSGEKIDGSTLEEVFDQHTRMIEDLQYQALQLRLTPLVHVFNRFPRMVRDLGQKLEKTIHFEIRGGEVELDRSVLDVIGEPLVHLLRNAADHGIVNEGTIWVEARREQGGAVIDVRDDGAGINWEKLREKHQGKEMTETELIFSGTSTAEHVSDISGRGVGLATVRARMKELGGDVEVESPVANTGKGTRFLLKFPVSLAIIQAVIVQSSGQRFALSISALDRLLQGNLIDLREQMNKQVFAVDEQEVPFAHLNQVLGISQDQDPNVIMLVNTKIGKVGIGVDAVLSQQNVVVKAIPAELRKSGYFNAVTLLGDGSLVPILDHESMVQKHLV